MHFVCREIGIENTSKMNINLYKAKLKISREDLRGYLFDNQCTKETVSFFNGLLENISRVPTSMTGTYVSRESTSIPAILSEKGARKYYQVRVEYYEKQKQNIA